MAPGTQLGRYQLLRRLAVGGMAELYLARATGIEGFEKLVALKRILPQLAESSDFVSMFLDEARLAARLQHANIAQVHDIGQTAEGLFFTMEFVHGQDLRHILKASHKRRERVPLEHALCAVNGAAAGLHAAHEKCAHDGTPLGIVHRDVSPSNVIVSYDGCVKLIDFGVAKASRRQTETRAGTLKGKIAYMSPEQCRGGAVDRRSDIFALGILLYELTCGRRLFFGDNDFNTMRRIVAGDVPPPSTRRPGYPPALERIVMKALSTEPDDRYQTAQELQLELECFARDHALSLSSVQLGRYMRTLFADELRIWEQLRIETEEAVRALATGRPRLRLVSDDDTPGSFDLAALPLRAARTEHEGTRTPGEDDDSLDVVLLDDDDDDESLADTGVSSPALASEPAPASATSSGRRWSLWLAGVAFFAVVGAALGTLLPIGAAPVPAERTPATGVAPAGASTDAERPEPAAGAVPAEDREPAPAAGAAPDDTTDAEAPVVDGVAGGAAADQVAPDEAAPDEVAADPDETTAPSLETDEGAEPARKPQRKPDRARATRPRAEPPARARSRAKPRAERRDDARRAPRPAKTLDSWDPDSALPPLGR